MAVFFCSDGLMQIVAPITWGISLVMEELVRSYGYSMMKKKLLAEIDVKKYR